MTDKRKQFEDDLLDAAIEGVKAIKARLTYKGSNQDYHQSAKIGAVPVVSYVKLRGTMANEKATEIVERKLVLEERKQLSA